jgi:hypothetical protein
MANIPRLRAVLTHKECLDTALTCGILAIYHKPEVPYCYFKLVTNIIRTVKIHVLSYLWYMV